MNWEEIKEIIKTDGGKFIIVEEGQPTLVIISFEDYKNQIKCSANPKKANPELKSSGKEYRESADELTIDDLPL